MHGGLDGSGLLDDGIWKLTFDLFDQRMGMTTELIKVAGFVASFSALQFTVSLLSDRGYEDEFLQGLRADLRQAFAVRAVYLKTVLTNSSA